MTRMSLSLRMWMRLSREQRGIGRAAVIAAVFTLGALAPVGCGLEDEAGTAPDETGTVEQAATSDFIPYPWSSGQTYLVTQGNGGVYASGASCVTGGDHVGLGQYAWDWGMPTGTVVRASKGGTVKLTQFLGTGDACYNGCGSTCPYSGGVDCTNRGNYVVIAHGDGTTQALYLHLSRVDVAAGQAVAAGQQIGLSGNSGWSTGPHLHFMNSNAGASYYSQSVASSFNGTVPACRSSSTSSNTGGTSQTSNASVGISVRSFLMPGQIERASMTASNTGTSTWVGGGSGSLYRLGAPAGNGLSFSGFPQCGGYYNGLADSRVYTCSAVGPGGSYTYQLDARAPTSGTAATLKAQMIQDSVGYFGNSPSASVRLGQAYCGTAVTQCILDARPDLLPFYQSNGWSTACNNRDNIVNNWCGIDPTSCNNLKSGTCAAFNSGCRCSGGTHLGGAAIDPNGTFCGYKVCGSDHRVYECQAGWVSSTATCN